MIHPLGKTCTTTNTTTNPIPIYTKRLEKKHEFGDKDPNFEYVVKIIEPGDPPDTLRKFLLLDCTSPWCNCGKLDMEMQTPDGWIPLNQVFNFTVKLRKRWEDSGLYVEVRKLYA